MSALTLDVDGASLAALHDPPTGPIPERGPRGAVVCHPHPLFGGTMHNKVVHTLAKALAGHGLHVLRFDFRGAGGSTGAHDAGRAEREDARVALDHVAGLVDGPLLMAGFSFGSWVGCSAALDDPRVCALLAVAPPVDHYDFGPIGRTDLPLAVVYAARDELVSADHVRRFIATCAHPPRVTSVDGAGHLFHGRLAALRSAVDELLAALR